MPHLHEKIDFTVETFIVHDDKVLLRLHDKYKIWLSVGGHIELDEDPTEAAVREVKEEVGLDVTLAGQHRNFQDGFYDLLAPRFMNRHKVSDTHEHVTFVYFGTVHNTDIKQAETHEKSEDIRWFSRQDLDDPRYALRENVNYYAKAALEELAS